MYGHGLLFINTGFGKANLLAVRPDGDGDVTDTHVVWTEKKSVPSKPSQLLVGDLIYMMHDAGVATCLEAKTGKLVWQKRVGGKYSSSPLYAGGRIYFFSHDGKTTVIAAGRKYRQLAANPLGAKPGDGFRGSPAAAGNALYLRNLTHLYRIQQTSPTTGR